MRLLKNKNKKYLKLVVFSLWLVACCLLLVGGCGYTTRSLITKDFRTIYVRPFVNKIEITPETSVARRYKTYQPFLENDITKGIINEFILDGNLRLSEEEDADLILKGELIDFRRDALRYTGKDNQDIEEYRISLVVNVQLWDNRTKGMLWQVNNLVGDTTYFTRVSSAESTAISNAVADLARRVVSRVVEVW